MTDQPSVSPSLSGASREVWLRRARRLALLTVAYNLVEGVVSVGFGWADASVALFGFGVDSFIEVGSALLVLWRLGADAESCATTRLQRERRAALGIGLLLGGLALGTAVTSGIQLMARAHPDTTLPGVLVSLASLGFMVWLWRSKLQAARALDSRTLAGDAACSLACIQLSGVLFAGSLLFLLWPSLWWVDAAAAILLCMLIGRESLGSIRGALRKDFQGGCGCH